jgi:phenylpyruvate tautomerase
MIVKIQDECALSFAGTFDPAYTVNIYSIGKINPSMNVDTSEGLSKFLTEEMGLPSDRGYISFHDMKASNMGYKGDTFENVS